MVATHPSKSKNMMIKKHWNLILHRIRYIHVAVIVALLGAIVLILPKYSANSNGNNIMKKLRGGGSNEKQQQALQLSSSAFLDGETIPKQYTCEGTNISPPLKVENIPTTSGGTSGSMVLIVDDPDAPDPNNPNPLPWVHWVVYNIPIPYAGDDSIISFTENESFSSGMNSNILQGKNDFGNTKYGGPCPPIGEHRYYFTLYVLETTLSSDDLQQKPVTKEVIEKAMKGKIISQTQLMGKYKKG